MLFTNNTQASIQDRAVEMFLGKAPTTFLDHGTVAFAFHSEKTAT